MPSFCAYSDCVCYYWWSHVNARILCIFRLCVLYWWSHVNSLILCIFRLFVLLLMVTCKCPHFVHIQIMCVITDGHMWMSSFCAYSDCVSYYWWSHVNALILCIFRLLCVNALLLMCYYWWSHVNALILCIFRLCVLLLMVTCINVITDGHM